MHVERRLNKAKGKKNLIKYFKALKNYSLGLKLTITGIARCGWKKGKGKSSIKFEGRQTIFESHQYFFGKLNGEPVEVSTGIHLYKFSCKIPMNVVSSHHGTHGAINYKVKDIKIILKIKIKFILGHCNPRCFGNERHCL